MMRGCALLAVMLVAFAPGRLLADDADVRMEMSRWVAGAYDAPGKCRYTCQGDEMASSSSAVNRLEDMPERYECWGFFKMWCGAPPSGGPVNTEQLSGSACQGHYKSVMMTPSAHPNSKVVYIMCEGGHAWVSRRTATCPHTGKRWKKMMGTMGAGDSSSGMMYPKGPSTSPAATFASLLATTTGDASQMAAALRSDKELTSVTSALLKDMSATPPEGTFGLESRASGMSVDWKATREVAPDSADVTPQEVMIESVAAWESLDEDANSVLGSSWLDYLPHFSGGGSSSEGRGEGERPTIECNGKPAWMYGAFPCMGNLTVAGTRSSSPTTSTPSKGCGGSKPMKDMKDKMPRVLKAVESSSKLVLPGQTLTQVKDAPAWSQSMHAECDGFWGGLLRQCWGVTTSHVEVQRHGEFQMGKRSICSGRSGIKFINHNGARGMSSSCKGRHVMGLLAVIPSPAPTPTTSRPASF